MENFKKLEDIVTNLLSGTPQNITGVGFGLKSSNGKYTNEKSIVFNVDKKIPLYDLTPENIIPKTIQIDNEIYTTDVVESKIELFSSCPSDFSNFLTTPPSNRNKIRPLKGGISMTNFTEMPTSRGTLGFLAVDNDTN
jgi:hypothetical protein